MIVHSCISLFLTGLYLLILVYLIKGWAALKRPKVNITEPVTKVTILIAARNEEARIAYTID
ncbi:MAG: glycosyl transferase, partial [Mucilaginibacter sp.]